MWLEENGETVVVKSAGKLRVNSQGVTSSKDGADIIQLSAPYVLGFICIYVKTFASMTSWISLPEVIDGCLFFAGAFFLVLHIVSKSKDYGRRLIPLLLFILSTAYTYLVSGETAPLTFSLIVIAAATAGNTKSLVGLWFIITLLLSLFSMSAYGLTAILEPNSLPYVLRLENGVESTVRFTFFFSHPNMAAAIAMMMCGSYMYLNYDRLGFRTYAGVLVIGALVFLFTDSKTSMILIAFLVVCFAAQKKWGVFDCGRVRRLVGVLPIVLFALVYVVAGPLYNDSLGSLFTGRVRLWHYCLENQGLTLFGQRFVATQVTDETGNFYYFNTLDSAYAAGLLMFGLCFSAFFCWCVHSCMKRKDSSLASELPLTLAMLVFGFTEVHMFNPVICVALLFLSKGILPPPE